MADIGGSTWFFTMLIFAIGSLVVAGGMGVIVWCVWNGPAKRGPFKSVILCRLFAALIALVFITGVVLPVYRVVTLILTMGGFL